MHTTSGINFWSCKRFVSGVSFSSSVCLTTDCDCHTCNKRRITTYPAVYLPDLYQVCSSTPSIKYLYVFRFINHFKYVRLFFCLAVLKLSNLQFCTSSSALALKLIKIEQELDLLLYCRNSTIKKILWSLYMVCHPVK